MAVATSDNFFQDITCAIRTVDQYSLNDCRTYEHKLEKLGSYLHVFLSDVKY